MKDWFVKTSNTFTCSATLLILIFIILNLSSCTHDVTSRVSKHLKSPDLSNTYKTKPVNLVYNSKCKKIPSIKILNVDKNTDKYVFLEDGGASFYAYPKTMTESIVEYLKQALIKCNLDINDSSDKTIEVSFYEGTAFGSYSFLWWSWGAEIWIKISIPEINYTRIYKAEDWAGADHVFFPIAGVIHLAIWQFIEDPVFQDYARCRITDEQLDSLKLLTDSTKDISPNGAISVESGTYGGNCSAPRGNVTKHLADSCNNKKTCEYKITRSNLGDPYFMCHKQYVAEWRCGDNRTLHRAQVRPEAIDQKIILKCP